MHNSVNFEELLARSRRVIWNISDCNGTRADSQLVRKRTLNHLSKLGCLACWVTLAKWLSFSLRIKLLWVQVPLQSLMHLYLNL